MDLVRKALSSVSPENSFGDASCFRKVYTFSWGGKKYVMKVDNKFLWKEEETGFCFHEHEKWKSWSQYSRGRKWLAPILASGQIKRPCQPPSNEKESWVVMPKLQPLPNVLRSSCNYSLERYLREKILPKLRIDFPEASWDRDRIHIPDLSNDLHVGNWAMDNRGNWFIIDYA